jgi:hypothetical protein
MAHRGPGVDTEPAATGRGIHVGLNAVLDARPEIREPINPIEPEKIVGNRIRNLTFGYNETPLLKGLSRIGKGMRVGIVGPVEAARRR